VTIVRLAKKRFMGRATAFDVILGIMMGSIVGRAITGNAPFAPALAAAAALVGLHWIFSGVALHWRGFGKALKGRSTLLVRNGEVDARELKASHMTERDLWEDLRSEGISKLDEVSEARLERNGKLSVIKRRPEPKVIEIDVRQGVQTVRLELS
jgi:uncharacterized membrane protein YcaP (DUF421 family)